MDNDNTEITEIRRLIDEVDEELLRILNRRAELAIRAGELKRRDDRPYYTPEREREVFDRLAKISGGPLQRRQIEAIFREVISVARSLEKTLEIGYWGPVGTFTHLAALKQFGREANFNPLDSIEEVFRAVEQSQADYGVVPVENSLVGVVPETLDMFARTNVRICAEVYVDIAHHLLTDCESLDAIERVYAGPQPAAQCRRWLRTNLPRAEVVEVVPTAKAAERAKADPSGASIGTKLAAENVGIGVLHEHIEDNPHNRTRFLVVGYNEPAPTGRDRCSLMFILRNRPGELYRALGAFDRYDVNLTMIESRPAQRAGFEYIFYCDCQGHHTDHLVAKAIETLRASALECVILGSYPEAADAPSPA
ncbi:MAG: prephenate dehydratase [Armatimonadetes bacterium]|nr:prephenate dehydratase [Armatimonadota bacterium]NOG91625.1 prephenate dehydratase [Armatimonadota bacterium]